MPRSIQPTLPTMEVNPPHCAACPDQASVKTLHDVPLVMAKARVGAAVTAALGNQPLKAFGHEGLMSAVCSGEKVPDYLARIVQDTQARRRFALSLLDGDPDVVITTTITMPR